MTKEHARTLGLNWISFDLSAMSELATVRLDCPGPMTPLAALALSSSLPIILFSFAGLAFGGEVLYLKYKGTYTSLTTLRHFHALWRLLLLVFTCT